MPQIHQCPYCHKKILTSTYAIIEHFSNCHEYNKQLKQKNNEKKHEKNHEKILYY